MSDRARNSIRGRKAQQVGDAFESWLEIHHERARRLGILAHVDKIDPPAVVRGGKIIFGEKTVADWVGALEGGRYLAVEQKSTLDVYLSRRAVSQKQQDHLETVARAGGLALLVVEFRNPTVIGIEQARHFAVPWLEVPWQVLRTAESVSEVSLVAGGWLVVTDCYLDPFHPRGVPSTPPKRKFARD